jgi:GntR family transcriptional regulator
MRIHISPTDGIPIYLQVVQQIRRLVAAGELTEGEELPSIRALAERLVVNPNTIARAYRELESAGVVTFSRGLGTFIAATDLQSIRAEKQAILAEKIDGLIEESRTLDVPFDELIDMIRVRETAFRSMDEKEVSHER